MKSYQSGGSEIPTESKTFCIVTIEICLNSIVIPMTRMLWSFPRAIESLNMLKDWMSIKPWKGHWDEMEFGVDLFMFAMEIL